VVVARLEDFSVEASELTSHEVGDAVLAGAGW
jgi:hypothetical protein